MFFMEIHLNANKALPYFFHTCEFYAYTPSNNVTEKQNMTLIFT